MPAVVVIAGAPGAGKSSVSRELQARLDCPVFEFGWIPEFRNTGDRTTAYEEDEQLAFECLVLVVRKYVEHGYRNVIVTDLQEDRPAQALEVLADLDVILVTLRVEDEQLLRRRVLEETRSSDYRDDDASVALNRRLLARDALPGEVFVDVGHRPLLDVVDEVHQLITSRVWTAAHDGGPPPACGDHDHGRCCWRRP
ncbi:MAG: AAA family ATPase [Quadrisphaera sp.]